MAAACAMAMAAESVTKMEVTFMAEIGALS